MIRRPSRSTLFPYTTFFFNNTATTEIYPLSLHDALPISFACTVNEPQVVANNGYHTGEFPPGRHDLGEARHVNGVMREAHRTAVAALRTGRGAPQVGTCLQLSVIEPLRPEDAEDRSEEHTSELQS